MEVFPNPIAATRGKLWPVGGETRRSLDFNISGDAELFEGL
jgi:hypothetical protein